LSKRKKNSQSVKHKDSFVSTTNISIIRHSSHLVYPRSGKASQKSKISDYTLSENIEDRSECPLALAYVLKLKP